MVTDSMECRQMPEITKIVGILTLLLFIGDIKCLVTGIDDVTTRRLNTFIKDSRR